MNAVRVTGFLVLGGCLLLLAACARTPLQAVPEADWEQRRQALDAIMDWELDGRIAITGPEESFNASLSWRQRRNRYEIRMRGPLGQGGLVLKRDDRQVYLSDGEHEMTAADAETLLRKLGLGLPLGGLRYWIRGLPQPGIPSSMIRDAQARLTSLQQAGWKIRFLRYKAHHGLDLPAKVFLQGHGYKVRVLVHDWRLPPSSPGGGA